MSQGRWKYKTAVVTVDENSVTVRGLTIGERLQLANAERQHEADVKAGKVSEYDSTRAICKLTVIDPAPDSEDFDTMPTELMLAAVKKVIKLTAGSLDEKKDEAPEPS